MAGESSRVSHVVAQSAIVDTNIPTRVSHVVAQSAVVDTNIPTRVSQVIVQVAILQSGAVAGTTPTQGWGYVIG